MGEVGDASVRRRYVLITEYGVPPGRKDFVREKLEERRRRVEVRCAQMRGEAPGEPCAFDLFSLGASDLVSIHAVSDIRFLSAFNDFVPVRHQRSMGAFIPDYRVDFVERFIREAARGGGAAESLPVHAVVQLKLDPLVSLLGGDLVVPALVRALEAKLGERAVVLRGLDNVETIMIVKAQTLEELSSDVRFAFELDLGEIGLDEKQREDFAARLERLNLDVEAKSLASVPLLLSSNTTVGMCAREVSERKEDHHDEGAFVGSVQVFQQFRIHPVPAPVPLESLSESRRPDPPSFVFGSDDIFVRYPDQSLRTRDLADLVRGDDPVFPTGSRDRFYRRRTLLAPSAGRMRRWPKKHIDTRLREQLQARLDNVREAFTSPVGNSWMIQLRERAKAHHWPYPVTNASLSLILSLSCLVSDPYELQNYLDLIEVFEHWLHRHILESPHSGGGRPFRLFRHLDRVVSARAHRESPGRPPAVTRASEARAAQVYPRDILNAYLFEVNKAVRGPDAPPPLLVDGSDSELRVKVGDGTGILMINPLRLHQPLLWPMLGHELAHVLFETTRFEGLPVGSCAQLDLEFLLPSHARVVGEPLDVLMRTLAARLIQLGESFAPGSEAAVHAPDYAAALLEVASDLVVFDCGLLGQIRDEETRIRRFAVSLLPNLHMDVPFQVRAARGHAAKRAACRRLGFRLAALFALLRVAGPESDRGRDGTQEVGAALRGVMESELVKELMRESMATPGRALLEPDADSERTFQTAVGADVMSELESLFCAEAGSDRLFSEALATALSVLNALRRPELHHEREGRQLVARHLEGCLAACTEEADGALVFPRSWERGGIEPTCGLGRESVKRLPDFLEDAASLVRAQQSRALERLFSIGSITGVAAAPAVFEG